MLLLGLLKDLSSHLVNYFRIQIWRLGNFPLPVAPEHGLDYFFAWKAKRCFTHRVHRLGKIDQVFLRRLAQESQR